MSDEAINDRAVERHDARTERYCPHCGGTGVEPCRECDGFGIVLTEEDL